MYFVEFFSRNEGVPLEVFHHTVRDSLSKLEAHFAPDRLGLLVGRTFRLGRRPNYLALWELEGLDRLERRREILRQPEPARELQRFQEVATVHFAGIYEDWGEEQL